MPSNDTKYLSMGWIASELITHTLKMVEIGIRVIQYEVIQREAKFWLDPDFHDLLTPTDPINIFKVKAIISSNKAHSNKHFEW